MMHIPCVNLTDSYTIHGIRKESMVDGICETACTIAFERKKAVCWAISSKVKCQFINNEDEQEKSNFERFAEEAQEALNPLQPPVGWAQSLQETCLEHDEICREVGRLASCDTI